ncbi:APC family permease [Actinomadura macra]|uniref:APC family permease n=1 Tax=Actinomadura macra TaxID=46164 RepID=UPI00082B9369|nr:amino acid permease [Actinomadura macra]
MTWDIRMRNNMFRRLPVEQATGRLYGGRHRLRVVYRTRDLIVLGLGVMIGSGIFKIAGEQATATAGPGVLVSFLIAGGVCVLAALAYAELSSIIPVAGSAYSFSYVAFGEVWAWVVGWSLVMELLLAASVLARVWSLYATQALHDFGVPVPAWLGDVIGQMKGPDVFAFGILLLLIVMLATGSRMSLRTLWFMVMGKMIVIGLVIATGMKFFHPSNLTPFVPPAKPAPEGDQTVLDALLGAVGGGTPHVFGVWGLFAAAPAIAFAYIGFDLIATASEETDDAPRKVPRGILTALITTIVVYAAVAVAFVGMVGMDGFAKLNSDKLLLAAAFDSVGAGAMGKIVDVGAMLGLTTVILVLLVALSRVVFSMSRDGLLPRPLAEMSRYKVPSRATLLSGAAAVVASQTLDVLTLEQLVVIGTLFAFLFVAAAVLALRRDRPDLHRPFRVPAAPITAVVTIVAVGWLMLNLKVQTWGYFTIWMVGGLLLYLVYGRRKSQMKLLLESPPAARPVAAQMAAPPPPGSAPFPTGSQSAPAHAAPVPYGSGQYTPQQYGAQQSGAHYGAQHGAQRSGGYPGLGQQGTGQYPAGQSGGFGAEPSASGTYGTEGYGSGAYGSGAHGSGSFDSGRGAFTSGSHGAGSGSYGSETSGTGSYESRPYGSGSYGSGSYGSESSESGTFGSGGSGAFGSEAFESGAFGSGTFGSGSSASDAFGSGQQPVDPWQGPPQSGEYPGSRYSSGQFAADQSSAGRQQGEGYSREPDASGGYAADPRRRRGGGWDDEEPQEPPPAPGGGRHRR